MEVWLVSKTESQIEGLKSLLDIIAYTARVSNPDNQMNSETAPKLIAYLIRNQHWSPFEMVSMTLGIQTTRDISRQILRHRSFSFQEFSQRYAKITPEPWFREARLQDNKNRQNSWETDDVQLQRDWELWQEKVWEVAQNAYSWALNRNIAKEQARVVLPEGLTETTLYMSGTVRSWIHYVQLRAEHGTQKEHTEIAKAAGEILAKEGIEV